MAWFKYNQDFKNQEEYACQDEKMYTYQQFSEHFVYLRTKRIWHPRKKGFAIGRMQYCVPTAGERFYLRPLLTVAKGAKSFVDLKTVQCDVKLTFKEACVARGFVEDDSEWFFCFREACHFSTGESLRSLFITALTHGSMSITTVSLLWRKFSMPICDDLVYQLSKLFLNNDFLAINTDNVEPVFYEGSVSLGYGRYLLEKKLQAQNKSLSSYDIQYFSLTGVLYLAILLSST